MNVIKLPDPLPKVHQCGCGSQAFHLCADGRVVCLQCRYIIEGLNVYTPRQLADSRKELMEALRQIEGISGLDNEIAAASKHIVSRMADIHQIAGSLVDHATNK